MKPHAIPVLGSEENFKITHPEDFARAEAMLINPMDIRVGTGFDVHAFDAGDHVILNGVRIPGIGLLRSVQFDATSTANAEVFHLLTSKCFAGHSDKSVRCTDKRRTRLRC